MAKLKIYTKKGDRGETSLVFGERVLKNHPRIKAIGAIDELNAAIGVATSYSKYKKVQEILQEIQNELFNIGAEIASSRSLKKANTNNFYILDEAKIASLESIIDQYEENLPTLKNFILPSGSKSGVHLHLARTVCRRAEREVVTLSKKGKVNEYVLKYLNRLSDLLFVFARIENRENKAPETQWRKD